MEQCKEQSTKPAIQMRYKTGACADEILQGKHIIIKYAIMAQQSSIH
jgi:hypothetical protein